jgi:transcriptional regulator with XRE-family HTH domain
MSVKPEAERSPNPIDVHVGLQVRLRRKELKISQERLADALGLTFQQVQKYERGANRISISMLVRAAKAMKVRPSSLLPDENEADAMASPTLAAVTRVRGAEEVLEAYMAIPSPRLRRAALQLMRTLVEETAPDHHR